MPRSIPVAFKSNCRGCSKPDADWEWTEGAIGACHGMEYQPAAVEKKKWRSIFNDLFVFWNYGSFNLESVARPCLIGVLVTSQTPHLQHQILIDKKQRLFPTQVWWWKRAGFSRQVPQKNAPWQQSKRFCFEHVQLLLHFSQLDSASLIMWTKSFQFTV